MNKIIFKICCYLLICGVDAKWFHLGRLKGGNLAQHITDKNLPKPLWFKQLLDHFSPSDKRTWKQKYFVNDTYCDPKRPGVAFLMIGGEGKEDGKWIQSGQWLEYAKKFNAISFLVEHRYYGDSHPTDDMSTKNMVYLSSEQALADLAYFIVSMNDQYKFSNTKWVAFGGSYSGSLAAWVRLKYPHLIHAAVSSSAPLLATVDFEDYFKVVMNDLSDLSGGEDCVAAIKTAFADISKLLQHRVGQKTLETDFKLCSPLSEASKLDIFSFYDQLTDNFAGVAQYNRDNNIGHKSNITIDTICNIMRDKSTESELKRLASFNSIIMNQTEQNCLDYKYETVINNFRSDNWTDVTEGGRQWFYQVCTEFGFFQTSSAVADIFGVNLNVDYYVQQCTDVFGKKYNANLLDDAVERTNMIYGALDIQADRIVFIHGSVDPWHALGITNTVENNAPAIYIKGTAHCADMYPASSDDLAELTEARVEIAQYLSNWLETIKIG